MYIFKWNKFSWGSFLCSPLNTCHGSHSGTSLIFLDFYHPCTTFPLPNNFCSCLASPIKLPSKFHEIQLIFSVFLVHCLCRISPQSHPPQSTPASWSDVTPTWGDPGGLQILLLFPGSWEWTILQPLQWPRKRPQPPPQAKKPWNISRKSDYRGN